MNTLAKKIDRIKASTANISGGIAPSDRSMEIRTGHDLLLYRVFIGASQRKLAQMLRISPRVISKYEGGGVELTGALLSQINGIVRESDNGAKFLDAFRKVNSQHWYNWLDENNLKVSLREYSCSECGHDDVIVYPMVPELKRFVLICPLCGEREKISSINAYRQWFWSKDLDFYNASLYAKRTAEDGSVRGIGRSKRFSSHLFWFIRNVLDLSQYEMSVLISVPMCKIGMIERGTVALKENKAKLLIEHLTSSELPSRESKAIASLCALAAYKHYEQFPGSQRKKRIQADLASGAIFELIPKNELAE
ncbi:hypothetical protein A6E01_20745 (plasmid) [Vibrio breoganii]|uniref:Helix-turn-helix domain-containing protein n=1 Tax=Vibrio breoganii TaxID=553239 RepID=A0AAN0Y063_9VIBR|nr:helix-turn-helix transcriptional regulator [Vibrio breoganii]ANO35642.1 hypothetical protein A6E01_20745 [Vibrio breoganii]PML19308.1 hypothetical protein BCT84_18715 [Vibrio breoganii]